MSLAPLGPFRAALLVTLGGVTLIGTHQYLERESGQGEVEWAYYYYISTSTTGIPLLDTPPPSTTFTTSTPIASVPLQEARSIGKYKKAFRPKGQPKGEQSDREAPPW